MFAEADKGRSLRGIGQELERRGVPPPYHGRTGSWRWGQTTVRRILANPKYAGAAWAFDTAWEPLPGLTKGGNPRKRLVKLAPDDPRRIRLPDGVYPRVIDPALFDRVQKLIAARARERQRADRDPHVGLLRRGFAKCALCGYTLVVRRHSKPGLGFYYCCAGCGRNGCGGVAIMTHLLDEPVWRKVLDVLTRPQAIRDRLARLCAEDTTAQELALLDRVVEGIEAKQAKLANAVALLDDEDAAAPLLAQLKVLAAQRKQANADRGEVLARRARWEEDQRGLRAVLDWNEHVRRQVAGEAASMTWDEQRRALALLGAQVVVFPQGHAPRWALRLSWDVPDDPDVSPRYSSRSFAMGDGVTSERLSWTQAGATYGANWTTSGRDYASWVATAGEATGALDRHFGPTVIAATASTSRVHSSSVVR